MYLHWVYVTFTIIATSRDSPFLPECRCSISLHRAASLLRRIYHLFYQRITILIAFTIELESNCKIILVFLLFFLIPVKIRSCYQKFAKMCFTGDLKVMLMVLACLISDQNEYCGCGSRTNSSGMPIVPGHHFDQDWAQSHN